MESVDLTPHSVEEMSQLAKQLTAQEIKASISKLNLQQLSAFMSGMNESRDVEWQKKTRAAISGLTQREQLEAVGKAITIRQFFDLISHYNQSHEEHKKLLPILIGMTSETFLHMIKEAREQEIFLLKQESMTEPIQHHLSMICHELTNKLTEITQQLKAFEKEIEFLDLEAFNRTHLQMMLEKIEEFSQFFQIASDDTSRFLSIAWNTNRIDLIEKLNTIKENCQNTLSFIGHPKNHCLKASGLFAKLENKIHSIYGDPDNPKDMEAMKNEELAIDAIVKFSIWDLHDYWEIGLLPKIENPKEIEFTTKFKKEKKEFYEELLVLAQTNLEKIGLATVQDLKQANIFSKKTLEEYIKDHQQKILDNTLLD